MNNEANIARDLLKEFKGNKYIFGLDCLDNVGILAKRLGEKGILVISQSEWAKKIRVAILKFLNKENIKILEIVDEPRPNTPKEDVYGLQDRIVALNPEFVIAVGGGSTIDCVKAAAVLSTYSPSEHNLEPFFGVSKVLEYKSRTGKEIIPILAVQFAASSGAHLTKYSNVTDIRTYQKKLIVDETIVPKLALFDYSVTKTMSREFTAIGALDGLAHALEVYYSATDETIDRIEKISLLSIEMIVETLPKTVKDPENLTYREMIGLGTDLGAYAIMIGGTNGAHLNSFSLVDILPHGKACGILNPYYTVFFSTAIERQLKNLYRIYAKYTNKESDLNRVSIRELGEIVAKGMINFSKTIGFPTNLSEVGGFNNDYIEKALNAAKDPQLEMKLKNMPVPLSTVLVDEYMRPILEAASIGNFSIIKNL